MPDLAGQGKRGSWLLGAVGGGLGLAYAWRLGSGPGEALRFLAGATALWAPAAVVVTLGLRASGLDLLARSTLGLVAAYAFTAMAYLLCASLGADGLFYALQISLAVVAVAWGLRRARAGGRPRIDWMLVALVPASLLVTAPYKLPFVEREGDARAYVAHRDHLFHVGIAAELGRGVPPRQSAIRAGAPDRAYHVLPHVSTLLLARFTGERDLLRVHLFQHYTAIEVLICLTLGALGRLLTGARGGGYLAVGAMYLLAVPWPPMTADPPIAFAFTLFPHYTNGLEAAVGASPQLYSGLVVLFGCLLAMAAAFRDVPRRARVGPTLLLAFILAATLRFRIHAFLGLAPGVLVALAWSWRRGRSWLQPTATLLALGLASLAYLEMLRPEYLPDTAALGFGYNGLTESPRAFFNSWPLASELRQGLAGWVVDEGARRWTWQVVSLSAFALLNVVGLPLAAGALLFLALAKDGAGRAVGRLGVSAAVLSVVLSWVLVKGEDSYSVAGQLLFHARWFLFPLGPAAAWLAWERLRGTRFARPVACASGVVAVGLVVGRFVLADSAWWSTVREAHRVELSADETAALRFLRDETPPKATVLAARHAVTGTPPARRAALFSGLAQRAAYHEVPAFNVHALARAVGPDDDREATLELLWQLADPAAFCARLEATGVDYLVEYTARPLTVEAPSCLAAAWRGPDGELVIWAVRSFGR